MKYIARRIGSVLVMGAIMAVCSFAGAETGVLGFQAWKTSRVDEAKAALERIEAPLATPSPSSGKPTDSKPLSRPVAKGVRQDPRLQQAQINFEIAQELTVTDYFVLYLSQFKDRDSLVDAAKKLAPEEVADLLAAYQKQLSGGPQADTPVGIPNAVSGFGSAPADKPARTGL